MFLPLDFDFSSLGDRHPLTTYAQGAYNNVDGWAINDALVRIFLRIDEFQALHRIGGNLCEIGVHHGRTFILMALMRRAAETAIAIDLFGDQDSNIDKSGSGDRAKFEANVVQYVGSLDNVRVFEQNSMFLSDEARFACRNSRLIHVDGGHLAENVAYDLHLAQSFLVPGGVIIVDDFTHSGFPGVAEGCFRFFERCTDLKVWPFATGHNKLFLVGMNYQSRIVSHLRTRVKAPAGRIVRLYGHDVVCLDPH